jgi:hypothetical protein
MIPMAALPKCISRKVEAGLYAHSRLSLTTSLSDSVYDRAAVAHVAPANQLVMVNKRRLHMQVRPFRGVADDCQSNCYTPCNGDCHSSCSTCVSICQYVGPTFVRSTF